jgi:hypothetical protein
MNTPLIHPLDLVGATGDRDAIATPWSERQPVHLDADDFDRPAAFDGDGWQQAPDGPLGAILVLASLSAVICALVLLL